MSYSIQFLEMQPGAKAKTFKPVQMQKPVIVFGSSGHARSIAVILEQLNIEIIGFIDSYLPQGTRVLKYKTLGDETILTRAFHKFGTLDLIVGIGDCNNRQKVVQKARCLNPKLVFPVVISPKACVATYTEIGQGTVVFCNTFINVEAAIGEFCVINSCSIIEHNTTIGNFITLKHWRSGEIEFQQPGGRSRLLISATYAADIKFNRITQSSKYIPKAPLTPMQCWLLSFVFNHSDNCT